MKKDAEEKKEFVPRYHDFAKPKLASYPNEDGMCVCTEKNHDEKDFFKLKNILKSRNSGNEELCHIGVGLGLAVPAEGRGEEVLAHALDWG